MGCFLLRDVVVCIRKKKIKIGHATTRKRQTAVFISEAETSCGNSPSTVSCQCCGRIVSAVTEWYDTVSQGGLLVGWIRSGKESPGLFFHGDVIRLATRICQSAGRSTHRTLSPKIPDLATPPFFAYSCILPGALQFWP